MNAQRIRKVQKCFMWGSLILFRFLSFFPLNPHVKDARRFFISLFWVLFVFCETADLMPSHKGWRDFVRIVVILLLAPSVVMFVLGGGNAVISYLSSPVIDDPAQVIQMTYREGVKFCSAIRDVWELRSLRQLNSNLNFFYLVIMLSVALCFIRLVWTWICLACTSLRREVCTNGKERKTRRY